METINEEELKNEENVNQVRSRRRGRPRKDEVISNDEVKDEVAFKDEVKEEKLEVTPKVIPEDTPSVRVEYNSNNQTYSNPSMPVYPNKESKPKKGFSGLKIAAMMMITVVISVLVGAGGLLLLIHYNPDLIQTTITNVTKTEKEVTVTDTGISDAVSKVWDAVVVVETYQNNQLYATGSGFIYKKENNTYYMLTNYHVISSGSSVKVVLSSGQEISVDVVGGDKYADIAVLSYETTDELTVAEIGSSVDAKVGDTVFAIGAPLDSSVYSWTVTRGVLSGKDREVEVSTSDNSSSSDWIMQVLQTDAAINSGNSGGPLCNSNGQVIGITNMKLVTTGVEGMGFAIPIEEAVTYADALVSGEEVVRPYLGISMQDASSSYYYYYGNSSSSDSTGVIVMAVESGSPADEAGLQQGDVITGLGDKEITNVASLRYTLYSYNVGDKVKVTFTRDGKTQTAEITLGSSKS